MMARFFQKFLRLSSPPKSVVKLVESTKTMSPGLRSLGGIQRRQLNSLLPASVKGMRKLEIDWLAREDLNLLAVRICQFVVRQMAGGKLSVGTLLSRPSASTSRKAVRGAIWLAPSTVAGRSP